MTAIDQRPADDHASAQPGRRLVSLDVLRGLTVAGMILVNAMAGVHYSVQADVFPLLLHAPWAGLTIADLVFPAFLFMVGVSIPLSVRPAPGARPRILWRGARLFLLGVILSNLYWAADFSSGPFRLFGVLQRIGLAYAAAALIVLACGPRARSAIIVAILALYWPLAALPQLDGGGSDLWIKGQNFVASVDRILLGPHAYYRDAAGYDPEGLLGTLPAIAHTLIGVAIGERLVRGDRAALRAVAVAGLAMLVAGLAWGMLFPIVKDIWSSSFVLVTCGATALALAGLAWWLDGKEARPGGALLLAFALPFGANAIAAYVLHMVTAEMPGWALLLVPFQATRGAIGDPFASLLPVALYIGFIWICVAALRRRGWLVKV